MNKFFLVTYNRLFNLDDKSLIDILFSNNDYLAAMAKDILYKYRIDDLDEVSSQRITKLMNLDDAWYLKDCHNSVILKRALELVYDSIDRSFPFLRIIK